MPGPSRPPAPPSGPSRPRGEDADSTGSAYTTIRVAKYGPPIVQCNDRRKQHPSFQQANGYIPNPIRQQLDRPSIPITSNIPSTSPLRHPPPARPPYSNNHNYQSGPSSGSSSSLSCYRRGGGYAPRHYRNSQSVPSSSNFDHPSRTSPPSSPSGSRYPNGPSTVIDSWTPRGPGDRRDRHKDVDGSSSSTTSTTSTSFRPPFNPPAHPRAFPNPGTNLPPRPIAPLHSPPPSSNSQLPTAPTSLSNPIIITDTPGMSTKTKKKPKKRKYEYEENEEEEVMFNSAFMPTLPSHTSHTSRTSRPSSSTVRPSSPVRPPTPPLPSEPGPAPRLVFKPNKAKTSKRDDNTSGKSKLNDHVSTNSNAHASSSRTDTYNARTTPPLIDEKQDHIETPSQPVHLRFDSEDRKPTPAELDQLPSTSSIPNQAEEERTSGVWAFKKTETPLECWSKNAAEKGSARAKFKSEKKAELKRMGRSVLHSMWRDDGFALTWEKVVKPVGERHGGQNEKIRRGPKTKALSTEKAATAGSSVSAAPLSTAIASTVTSAPAPVPVTLPTPTEIPVARAPVERPSIRQLSPDSPVQPIRPTSKSTNASTTASDPPVSASKTSTKAPPLPPPSPSPAAPIPPSQPPEVTSERLQALEKEIQEHVLIIDRWTTMQKQFPNQAETLSRQIDRVQEAIFAKFSLVEEERARLIKEREA